MGDIIVAVDGRKVAGADELIRLLDEDRIGRGTTFSVLRNGKARSFDVTPKERRGS
jgi:S1-C subfamily serine protease